MAATNDGGEGEDDVAVLIYRESQLRKAEAAAAAAATKKTSSASTHHRTSLGRERLPRTKAKNHCTVYYAKVLRNEENESLQRRMICRGKRWPKRDAGMNALLMDAPIMLSMEECA